ncbi:nucleotidyltransferase domain-containing protein [Methylobacterium sp. NEAU 140]|uniref:nucleotidyltransferase family protein n=1 Tax=Methylobacterium sp. NEAU 140 TaxID=3064945 RepID=UPI0027334C94|nr:nucleotidyltransferase domain-containing protein [Methylobacterium sp. NEAU 140]MDP4024759.1 nucleotidyltransferase domain-containing protein [Methylobacterium sp. NEAU 140]
MPSTDATITTVDQRKAAERDRRVRAAEAIVARLSAYARREGGRFVVFGSFVGARMRHDSDLDVLIDADGDGRRAAWAFLEDLGIEHGLDLDLFDRATTKPAFVARVEATGLHLP